MSDINELKKTVRIKNIDSKKYMYASSNPNDNYIRLTKIGDIGSESYEYSKWDIGYFDLNGLEVGYLVNSARNQYILSPKSYASGLDPLTIGDPTDSNPPSNFETIPDGDQHKFKWISPSGPGEFYLAATITGFTIVGVSEEPLPIGGSDTWIIEPIDTV